MENDLNYQNASKSLDEIVFENRNHNYGAYSLRKAYPWILTKSFILGTIFFLLSVGIPFVYLKVKQMNADDKAGVDATLVAIVDDPIIEKPEEKKEEVKPTPPPPKEEKVEVIKDVVPEPKKEPKHEEPAATNDEKTNKNTGTEHQEGEDKKQEYKQEEKKQDQGTGKQEEKKEEKKEDNSTHEAGNIDVKAQFPGGDNAFRQTFFDTFDQDILQDVEQTTKVDVSFVVEKDGSMTDIQATGPNKDFNAEAIKTVKSIRKKWAPGKNAGQPVRMRYRMAVSITPP